MSQSTSDERTVAKWSGFGGMRTRPFHVDGPWELQWNSAKGYFAVTLHRLSGDGPKDDLLANGMEGGSSSSYQPNDGDFYLEIEALQPWSARVVSVPGSSVPPSSKNENPLLPVEGDQSGLPPCDGPGADAEIKSLIENSPLARTMHISVLHVSSISSRQIKGGMTICRASVMTNGGEATYDFQYYRKDGDIYVIGQPVEEH